MQTFTEIVPREPVCWGLNAGGVAKYSLVGHLEGYIAETVQTVCIFELNAATKVKSNARVAMIKNSEPQTPCKFFSWGWLGESAPTQFFSNFWNCLK